MGLMRIIWGMIIRISGLLTEVISHVGSVVLGVIGSGRMIRTWSVRHPPARLTERWRSN